MPPAVVAAIIEYATAMPTWEVLARAGLEVAISVVLAFTVVKAIQKATDRAIHVGLFRTSYVISERLWHRA